MSGDARADASTSTLLRVTATTALAGIALCVAEQPAVGGWVVVASLVAMLIALHRFGRSGADAPERRRKRRKRKRKAAPE